MFMCVWGHQTTGVNLLRVTCIVAAPAMWLAFALSAIFAVAAVTWSDGCHFLDLGARQGWETVGLDGQSASVLDGCLAGEAVLDAFNLIDSLRFVEKYAAAAVKLYTDTVQCCRKRWVADFCGGLLLWLLWHYCTTGGPERRVWSFHADASRIERRKLFLRLPKLFLATTM